MQTSPTPQQQAIQQVRRRYERGEIPFDAFEHALDALLLAQTAEECQVILATLPGAPLLALTETPPVAAAIATEQSRERGVGNIHRSRGGTSFMLAVIGEVNRLRRPWKLSERFTGVALVGEMKLDLSLAALPPYSQLNITAVVGSATVYVPRTVRVRVRSVTVIGEVKALGESSSGILNFGHEESSPEEWGGEPEATIEIIATAIVGEVRIVQVDAPMLEGRTHARIPAHSRD